MLRKSGDQGHAQAQYNLGVMYAKGEGVRQSRTEAASWWQKAAEQGHPTAQLELGESPTRSNHFWLPLVRFVGRQFVEP